MSPGAHAALADEGGDVVVRDAGADTEGHRMLPSIELIVATWASRVYLVATMPR